MGCEDFLEGYSNFVDGRFEPPVHATFETHLESCDSCARYHRVVQRGLFIYRNLPELQPSSDFLPRLRHRLYHVDDEERLTGGTPVGSAALVAVAAVGFLALAWLPFATRLSVEVELPPVAVEPPPTEAGVPSLFSSGPFIAPRASAPTVRGAFPAGGTTVPAAGWGAPLPVTSWSFTAVPPSWTAVDAFPALFERTSFGPSFQPASTASTAAATR